MSETFTIPVEAPIQATIQTGSPINASVQNNPALQSSFQPQGVQGPQGNKGDKGDAGSTSSYTAQNNDSILLIKGTPITQHNSGVGFVRADGSNPAKDAIGFLGADTDIGFAGPILMNGTLSISDWTAISGTPTLAARAKYYLDTVTGKITNIAPTTTGQIVQMIGIAIDTITLEINITRKILL